MARLEMGVTLLACLIAAFALGCSDDSEGGPSCGSFTACGGNLVGSWTYVSNCGDTTTAIPAACKDAVVNADLQMTSTITFSADGTYSSKGTVAAMDYEARYTSACVSEITGSTVTDGDMTTFCAELSSTSEDLETDCQLDGAVCVCAMHLAARNMNTAGTYSVSGNSISTTDEDGDVSESTYCVAGSTLTVAADTSTRAYAIFEKQ